MKRLNLSKKHFCFGANLLFFSVALYFSNTSAVAKGLPDFTELVESSSPQPNCLTAVGGAAMVRPR